MIRRVSSGNRDKKLAGLAAAAVLLAGLTAAQAGPADRTGAYQGKAPWGQVTVEDGR